jgi:hypothetical protein
MIVPSMRLVIMEMVRSNQILKILKADSIEFANKPYVICGKTREIMASTKVFLI